MTKLSSKYVLAIDLGTSGPKVALISILGDVITSAFVENDLILSGDGGAEQDPEQWWQTILKAAKTVLDKKLVDPRAIEAICCTAQWSGTVAVDRTGKPLMNAVIWLDTRGHTHIRDITSGWINYDGYGLWKLYNWIRLSGGAPGHSGKDPIAHILYLKHQHPSIYQQTHKFLEPKDYINFKLTGKFAASYDSITLHWVTDNRNLNQVVYHKKLLKQAKLDADKLPELKPAISVLGTLKPELASELNLSESVKVIVGSPDVQSASVGSGAVRDYQGHIYIGTSSWVTCHVPFKAIDVVHKIASLPSSIPNRYLVTNEQESAGSCLKYLKNNLFFPDDELSCQPPKDIYQAFDRLAESAAPGSGRVIFTPWLMGERTPVEDHTLRASFFNQGLTTTRKELVRSVLEGVAYNTRWLLHSVEKFIKRRMNPIHIVGGGANSNVWCQILADVCNRTIAQVKDPIQANVRGAAFIASVSLGYMTFDQIQDRIEIQRTFRPNPKNQRLYNELYREFQHLYRRNKSIFRRLNS